MNRQRYIIALFFVLHISFAQTNDSIKKLKVGLVLSGGGAKGVAHIGVLKTLEKNGVYPDYITGTSMGAIVGGFYASGYNPQQIDSIFKTLNFDAILYNKYNRKYKQAFKKEHGKKYIMSLPFSFHKMSIEIPKGLSDSQKLFNTLAENLMHVSNIEDFSDLKIPFACVSTDISTGKQVLFNKGYLAKAITSSALLPSVFNPLEFEDKLLLDGGIVNNYPVEELRDMGADIIIGSDVQGEILKKEQITDMPSIMNQIVSFGMYKKMPLKKNMTNLYIRPNIDGIELTDFSNLDSIIKRGEKATINTFKNHKKLINQIRSVQKTSRLNFRKPDSLLFDQVIISGQNNFNRAYILGKIDIKAHKKISYHDFLDGINNLIATENFEKAHYRFRFESGQKKLYLDIKEKENKASMNLGFHYNNLYKINVIVNFENKRILTKNDLLSIEIIGGNHFRYNFDYIMSNGFNINWGFHSGLHRVSHQMPSHLMFDQDISINQLDFNYFKLQNKLCVQGNFNHFLYLKVGLQHEYNQVYTNVFSENDDINSFFFERNHFLGVFSSINFDNQDDFDFPTKGIKFRLLWNYNPISTDYYGNFAPFSVYHLEYFHSIGIFNNFRLHSELNIGINTSQTPTYAHDFYIGGSGKYPNFDNFISFSSLPIFSKRASNFMKASLTPEFSFMKKHHVFLSGNYIIPIYLNHDKIEYNNILGFSVGYGLSTFLGPLKLSYGYTPLLKKSNLSFEFGYVF